MISGYDESAPEGSDTHMLAGAQAMQWSPATADAISPWRFAQPLSPDMAAEEEGRHIDFKALVSYCRPKQDILLVEGVGGIMVPLDERHTVLDWMMALGFPAILVTGSYLGSINHTLLSARVLLSAGIALKAVIVSESGDRAVPLSALTRTLERFLPQGTPMGHINRLDSAPDLWKDVPDLTGLLTL